MLDPGGAIGTGAERIGKMARQLGGTSGGKFVYTPELVAEVIKRLEGMAEGVPDMRERVRRARGHCEVPPSDDYGSRALSQTYIASFDDLERKVEMLEQAVRSVLQRHIAARDGFESTDETVAESYRSQRDAIEGS